MNRSEWEALIQRHLDGVATRDEVTALSSRLETDADMRLVYLQIARVHAALATELAEESAATETPKSPAPKAPVTPRMRSVWVAAATFAATALIAVVTSQFLRERTTQPTPLARITEVNGAVQWVGDGGHFESDGLTGRPVGGGTLESLSVDSWAVLEYPDGTTITLSGQSRLTLVDGERKEVRLGAGRLSVSVAPQLPGRPMVIHTPTAQLEVLGTQLNVDSNAAATRVTVNEGRVRVTRLVDGSTTDVPAGQETVATVDRHTEFKTVRRPQPVGVWQSRFPLGVNYGNWQVAEDGTGSVRAKSLLLTCAKPKPLLIFVASAAVTGADASPLVLGSNGRFVVRGKLGSTAEVYFGMTMNHPKGGFAGNYVTMRKVETNVGKPFEWAIPLADLKPLESTFPASPAGLEIVECWCLTVNEDHDLAVRSIELRADQ